MLEEVLAHIHNWFEASRIEGAFTIEGGTLEIPNAQEGQYIRLKGSVFNDGLYQYPLQDLHDETFSGTVYLLAVPPAVVAVSEEIDAWCAANADVLNGPYQSESFGGYSYSKGSGGGSYADLSGWQLQFAPKLNRWRKLYDVD